MLLLQVRSPALTSASLPMAKITGLSPVEVISLIWTGYLKICSCTQISIKLLIPPPREPVGLSVFSDDETDLIRELQTMCSSKSEPDISKVQSHVISSPPFICLVAVNFNSTLLFRWSVCMQMSNSVQPEGLSVSFISDPDSRLTEYEVLTKRDKWALICCPLAVTVSIAFSFSWFLQVINLLILNMTDRPPARSCFVLFFFKAKSSYLF